MFSSIDEFKVSSGLEIKSGSTSTEVVVSSSSSSLFSIFARDEVLIFTKLNENFKSLAEMKMFQNAAVAKTRKTFSIFYSNGG